MAACFLLQLKFAARAEPDTPLSPQQQQESPVARVLLNRQRAKGPLTSRWV